jgi:hypothetical protein
MLLLILEPVHASLLLLTLMDLFELLPWVCCVPNLDFLPTRHKQKIRIVMLENVQKVAQV